MQSDPFTGRMYDRHQGGHHGCCPCLTCRVTHIVLAWIYHNETEASHNATEASEAELLS